MGWRRKQLANDGPDWSTVNLVAVGDSLTAGIDTEVVWAAQFATAEPGLTVTNQAVGGDLLELDIDTTTRRNAANAAYDAGKAHNVLVVWAGSNDLSAWEFTTPEELVGYVESYAANMKSVHADWIIVYATMCWRALWNSNHYTAQAGFNTLLRAGLPTGVDALADVDALIVDPTTNPSYYQTDDIHFTTAGQTVAYGAIRAAIESVIA